MMQVLFLAPHPFFKERGSPIAARLLLQTLSERGEQVDALVYNEGRDVHIPNVTLHRIPHFPFTRGVVPGFSWKKVVCDILMMVSAVRLVRKKRYRVIHAVEESVFIALLVRWIFKIPYVYDMDCRLSEHIGQSHRCPILVVKALKYLEACAIRNALAIVAVSRKLLTDSEQTLVPRVLLLTDVSLLEIAEQFKHEDGSDHDNVNLQYVARSSDKILMYVGNLQAYQGIDLLLKSFSLIMRRRSDVRLVIVGGDLYHRRHYQKIATKLKLGDRVHWLGPKPIAAISEVLSMADILISPRLGGQNTPMKLYSYLHSGKPTLATSIGAHKEVVTEEVALLVNPCPEAMSDAIQRLLEDGALRKRLGDVGRNFIEREHSYEAFQVAVNAFYEWLELNATGPVTTPRGND